MTCDIHPAISALVLLRPCDKCAKSSPSYEKKMNRRLSRSEMFKFQPIFSHGTPTWARRKWACVDLPWVTGTKRLDVAKKGTVESLSWLDLRWLTSGQIRLVCIAQCRRSRGWHVRVWLIINQRSLGSLSSPFTARDRRAGWWMGSSSGIIAHPGRLPRLNGRPG